MNNQNANNQITCPYCRFKGVPILKQKNGKKKYLCPQCGNVVSFRRK